MEQFLESEVTIRVHAENRGESIEDNNQAEPQNKAKRFKNRNKSYDQFPTNFPKCALCPESHQLFRCDIFKAMNLNGKKKHISDHDLCERCLLKKHTGRCKNKKSNDPCPRCGPEKSYHNSLICSNKELSVLLAKEDHDKRRKRKSQDKGRFNQAKKGRYSSNDQQNSGNIKYQH